MSMGRASEARRDRWIPGCFIAFFICLVALEVWFVILAKQSFTGVVTDDAYAVGLNYNDVLAQRALEKRLGWSTRLDFEQEGELGGRLRFSVKDSQGRALEAAEVRATAERLTRFPQIQPVEFSRQAAGDHLASLNVPLAGRWFIRIKVEQAGQSIHVIEEVDVRP